MYISYKLELFKHAENLLSLAKIALAIKDSDGSKFTFKFTTVPNTNRN